MPQSSKDSRGGKTHADNKTSAGSGKTGKQPAARNDKSPTGSQKKGEKKTTP
jgi:hypothetical protein